MPNKKKTSHMADTSHELQDAFGNSSVSFHDSSSSLSSSSPTPRRFSLSSSPSPKRLNLTPSKKLKKLVMPRRNSSTLEVLKYGHSNYDEFTDFQTKLLKEGDAEIEDDQKFLEDADEKSFSFLNFLDDVYASCIDPNQKPTAKR